MEFEMTEDPLAIGEAQKQGTSESILASGIVEDQQLDLILMILIPVMQIINLFSLIGNVMNVAVFVRLGFSETANISLTALALSDLVSVVLNIWVILCYWPPFRDSEFPFNPVNLTLLTGVVLRVFTIRTVACITAFISFERCLCIVAPFKMKRIITPRFTLKAMLIIALLTIGPYSLITIRYNFAWVFYPQMNATILDVVTDNSRRAILIEKVVLTIWGVVQPVVAFVIVVVCTIFLVIQLRKMASWRKSATSAERQKEINSAPKAAVHNSSSRKEERLAKMVVVIATNFIVCFTPTFALLLAKAAFEELHFLGAYGRILLVLMLITYLGESISAGVNILIYYSMTTKFRSTLRQLLRLDDPEK
ncbi:chemosensory receptor a [Plakobranchus ocellatus]|uniref:Chemosensory receptor a n=1 Tax=Plakobranchus ocellatus TaxID=259542 RepID=A0AAV4CD57_9GAST|nr:chemosensory receptor a [Plakobranchus ocellatus]